ncbi:MAG: vWA domain-containing protein, partial [Planctomycetota bacterium]
KSTFSIDVDTASYSNVRRFIDQGRFPHPGAVRVEEMINYFTYAYPEPRSDEPFAVHLEAAKCPWNLNHRLVRVGIKGKEIENDEKPHGNLVFLVDVSGSMRSANKLPLLKRSMRLLVDNLTEDDYVSIVVYASNARVVLPSTCARPKGAILAAIDGLSASGSTNGGAGIQWAYEQAKVNFVKGGVNRVILCSDGDFNVGVTSNEALVDLVRQEARTGVFLTVLGFGTGNYKDSRMEALADKGNGNYAYIDGIAEAKKVLVEQMTGTLVTIAKDVKIQVEFNKVAVGAWRLIGYENRILAHRDFDDDTKDAGEIGAGHTVTALYEVVPAGMVDAESPTEGLKYQDDPKPSAAAFSGELLTVKLRYKEPQSDTSKKMEFAVMDSVVPFAQATDDFRLASVVAAFGMLLRGSPHKGSATFQGVAELAAEGVGSDPKGRRAELVRLVKKASDLQIRLSAHDRTDMEKARRTR